MSLNVPGVVTLGGDARASAGAPRNVSAWHTPSPGTPRRRGPTRLLRPLWKDADPDIPLLKQAKAEYAKLKW